MRGAVLDEPELEFGAGHRHWDPRFGIAEFGPLDIGLPAAPERINVAIVGSPDAVDGVRLWLGRASEPIDAKPARYPRQQNLFPPFPGFSSDRGFHSTLVIEERNLRTIPRRVIDRSLRLSPAAAVQSLVEAYLAEISWLAENDRCDVIVCVRPRELDEGSVAEEGEGPARLDDSSSGSRPDFHDQLKAAALPHRQPLQIIRPETWGEKVKGRRVQDEATRAWNLHTALYYKAGGTPWRLVRSFADVTTCYLGVSFYKSVDGDRVHTSVAQLFNERGEGVVVRGGPAAVLKEDRQPHLAEEDAEALVRQALDAYRREHQTAPARLVIHKTSRFTPSEQEGFGRGADSEHIDQVEQLWISLNDPVRFFRPGEHPPLRGTTIAVAPDRHVLYTRGSVDFYGTYPGMYIPTPIVIRPPRGQRVGEQVDAETLALTKLNWNHSQMDGHLPITLHASNKVKAILRHSRVDSFVARRYAHYM
jgi:hypothetical protein